MIIAASRIPKYLHGMKFPVDVIEEKGKRVAFVLMNREELLAFCEVGALIGRGTWNRLDYLRVNRPMKEIETLRMKLVAVVPVAEDSRTVQLDGRTYVQHPRRSRAYSPESKRQER